MLIPVSEVGKEKQEAGGGNVYLLVCLGWGLCVCVCVFHLQCFEAC